MDWKDFQVVILPLSSPDSFSSPCTSTQNLKSLQIIGLRRHLTYMADCRYWKTVAFFAPLLGATLVAGYLVKDHHHSWYDCAVGAFIGTVIGYAHFRTSYFGVWDYKVNHIPLPREGFPLAEEQIGYFSRGNILIRRATQMGWNGVFTHEGGWGKQRQPVENTESQAHEREHLTV
jgi:hypothetical protein